MWKHFWLVSQCKEINQAACDIAKEVRKEKGTILAGGITQTSVYLSTKDKRMVQAELYQSLDILIENDIDLIIVEVQKQAKENVIFFTMILF